MLSVLKNNLTLLHHSLENHLPWTSLDFIRHQPDFATNDRLLTAKKLSRELPEENDLRFRYQSNGLDIAFIAERLPWDSGFFRHETAKLHYIHPINTPYDPTADYNAAMTAFTEALRQRGIVYVLAPTFPEDLAALRALGKAGFELITSLNYYHISVQDFAYPERFDARPAVPDDVPSLGKTAQQEVNPYDRFHADPFFTRADADRMMYQWVKASVCDGFADLTMVPNVPKPKAFCTVNYHQDKWEAWGMKMGQLVLSAIDREFRGWYLKCFTEILYHLKSMNAEHAYLSTQITNRAAIRQCEKLSFRYGRSEHTFRLLL